MDFAMSDYVRKRFDTVAFGIAQRGAAELQRATDIACRERSLETASGGSATPWVWVDAIRLGPARTAAARVQWWTVPGVVVVDGVLRVLPVDDGKADPVSELLIHGTWQTESARTTYPVEWSRRILELTSLALAAGDDEGLIDLRTSSRDARRGGLPMLLAELSHPGD